MELSIKGKKLIGLYQSMAHSGYDRTDGQRVDSAFNDFELRAFRTDIRSQIKSFNVSSVLDYGCGGSDWGMKGFDDESGMSATEYFGLSNVFRYEPARDLDERNLVDCVVSFDVLEHVFVSDIPNTLRDIFSYAKKLLILNVACYPAAAKLPNGENAHITVRPPLWWKGMVDGIAPEFPNVSILLICSVAWRQAEAYGIYSGQKWLDDDNFVIDY